MGEQALVVEDDPNIAYMLTRVLSRWGYAVVQARDGDQALAVVSAWRHQGLVVLDDQLGALPGEDFLDLCRRMKRASGDHAQIVVLGNQNDELSRARARAAGAAWVVRKPFHLPELAAACKLARAH